MNYTVKVGMKLERIDDHSGTLPKGSIVEVVELALDDDDVIVRHKGVRSVRAKDLFKPVGLRSKEDMEALYG